jgi:hypothetical protein
MILDNRARGGLLFAALALLFFISSGSVLALESTCTFDEVTQSIECTISGGNVKNYDIKTYPAGCVDDPASIPQLTGPEDTQSFTLSCIQANGLGTLRVEICDDILCYDTFELYFRCDGTCEITQIYTSVPSGTNWTLISIVFIILLSGIFVTYRFSTSAKRNRRL